MKSNPVIVPLILGLSLAACATGQKSATDAGPQMMPVAHTTVCDPEIVNNRATMRSDCLNRVERSPSAGKGYDAQGREIKGQRSLCNNTFMVKCRRKY